MYLKMIMKNKWYKKYKGIKNKKLLIDNLVKYKFKKMIGLCRGGCLILWRFMIERLSEIAHIGESKLKFNNLIHSFLEINKLAEKKLEFLLEEGKLKVEEKL